MSTLKEMTVDQLAEALYFVREACKREEHEEAQLKAELARRLTAGEQTSGRYYAELKEVAVSRVNWQAAFMEYVGEKEAENLIAASKENARKQTRIEVRDIRNTTFLVIEKEKKESA